MKCNLTLFDSWKAEWTCTAGVFRKWDADTGKGLSSWDNHGRHLHNKEEI